MSGPSPRIGGAVARRWLLAGLASFFLAAAAAPGAGEPRPKRVLILYSYGRDSSPFSGVGALFRTELARRFDGRVEFIDFSLEGVALDAVDASPSVGYLRALDATQPPDLVVTIAGPAALFWTENRASIAPGRPTMIAALEERRVAALRLQPDDVVVPFRLDLPGLLEDFLALRPGTTEVLAVFGSSRHERFWAGELEREWAPFRDRARLEFVEELPLDGIARRVSALRPGAAVFFGMVMRDAAGVPYDQQVALDRLHDGASAPIFSWVDSLLGHGTVGGRQLELTTLAREMGRVGAGMLAGGRPAAVRSTGSSGFRAVYDGRELRRWGIDEGRLPPGSEVRFRPPTFFQAYRWRIFLGLAVIVIQGLFIAALLEGRRRRRRAEKETLLLRQELAHAGRVTVMGQLASSLAHELAQPLGAILRNAEAAELFLQADAPDLAEVKAILADIRADDHRAGDVIARMRSLLRRRELQTEPLDVGRLVEGVAALVRPDSQARGVRIELDLERDLPVVRGPTSTCSRSSSTSSSTGWRRWRRRPPTGGR